LSVDIDRLEDGRVKLRPLTMDDVDDWLAGEDDEQIRWFEAPRAAMRGDVVAAIERWQEWWQADGPVHHWGIRDASSDALMGGVEVRDLGDGVFNLSYLVFPPFRRRGVAVGAATLAVEAAQRELGARTIRVKVLQDNSTSLAVAHRVGAVAVGAEPSDSGLSTFVVLELVLD